MYKRNRVAVDTSVLCIFLEKKNVDGEEEEHKTVVPKQCLDVEQRVLWWPSGPNVTGKKHCHPDKEKWKQFPLIKIVLEGE